MQKFPITLRRIKPLVTLEWGSCFLSHPFTKVGLHGSMTPTGEYAGLSGQRQDLRHQQDPPVQALQLLLGCCHLSNSIENSIQTKKIKQLYYLAPRCARQSTWLLSLAAHNITRQTLKSDVLPTAPQMRLNEVGGQTGGRIWLLFSPAAEAGDHCHSTRWYQLTAPSPRILQGNNIYP